ncbi:glycosyltransferase [uncultured Croceicoccus sp.]|uniref:glycosyltransferase n=1 Tax=uncultured Croceicoccus sp. TaxID=1295329 RepID=UPI0026313826|nr:glycosyltransferase [uncultured Croceicoccus sp.]
MSGTATGSTRFPPHAKFSRSSRPDPPVKTDPPMRIAVVAHIRHPLTEPFMGGMEAHAVQLSRGLRDAGHDVTLFAAPGGEDPDLVPICDAPYEAVLPWAQWRGTPRLDRYQRAAFDRAWTAIRAGFRNCEFDVAHNNSLFPDLIERAADERVPMVTSQHVPPFGKMREAVHAVAGCNHAQITLTSQSQMPLWLAGLGQDGAQARDAPANFAVVPNGVSCTEWQPATRSDRLLWYGRITPNKGLAEAIAAVREADAALDIYGPVEDKHYFSDRVAPALGPDIAYKGHASGAVLRAAVARARAVLVTPMWDEPFGLVAAEALASGVPVIAFDRGAMREVIGDCGIVVPAGDTGAMARAIGAVHAIDPARCRRRAETMLSTAAMIAGYEARYSAAMEAASFAAARSSRSSTRALLA